jgi:hypothetical protein
VIQETRALPVHKAKVIQDAGATGAQGLKGDTDTGHKVYRR